MRFLAGKPEAELDCLPNLGLPNEILDLEVVVEHCKIVLVVEVAVKVVVHMSCLHLSFPQGNHLEYIVSRGDIRLSRMYR